MSAHHDDHDTTEQEEEFIQPSDVLAELEDDGDLPMDDEGDDEELIHEDSSISQFKEHEGSVFTVAIHPLQPLVVSGGEDDLGYIWNLEDGTVVVKLTGHSDSVTTVGWSCDGELVATGGMDGKVRVWRRVKRATIDPKDEWKTWEFLTELSGPDEVQWLRWHPKGPVLLAGSNDSTLWLWQLPSGNAMQVLASHIGPVNAGCFTHDGKKVLTGSDCLLLTTPTSDSPIWKITPGDARFALEGGITALAINASNTLAVVGGVDGDVRVISLSKGEVVGSLKGHKEAESIEGVAWMEFAGTEVVVTGGTDETVRVWDLGTMRLRTTLQHLNAVTSLHPHPAPSSYLLTTSSADEVLRTWDVRTGELVREHKGHTGAVFGISIGTINGKVVCASAGDDGLCLVFALE